MRPHIDRPAYRGYADTANGQLHWRARDAAKTDIVLLHWAPASGRMYESVISELATRGVNGLAFDLPGFGASFAPPGLMAPAAVARCLSEGLATLTDRKVTVVGGHISAEIVVEWAIHAPNQVCAVVLDGVYALDADEFAPLVEPYVGLSPRLAKGRAHEKFLWRATLAVLKEWNPNFEITQQSIEAFYAAMSDYLQMGYPAIQAWMDAEQVAPGFGILDRIKAVAQPIMVVTAELDALRCAFERTVSSCRAEPATHEFQGVHPLGGGDTTLYADVLAKFVRSIAAAASSA